MSNKNISPKSAYDPYPLLVDLKINKNNQPYFIKFEMSAPLERSNCRMKPKIDTENSNNSKPIYTCGSETDLRDLKTPKSQIDYRSQNYLSLSNLRVHSHADILDRPKKLRNKERSMNNRYRAFNPDSKLILLKSQNSIPRLLQAREVQEIKKGFL